MELPALQTFGSAGAGASLSDGNAPREVWGIGRRRRGRGSLHGGRQSRRKASFNFFTPSMRRERGSGEKYVGLGGDGESEGPARRCGRAAGGRTGISGPVIMPGLEHGPIT